MQTALPLTRGLLQCLSFDIWDLLRRGQPLRKLLRQRPVLQQQQVLLVSAWAHMWDEALAAAATVATERTRQSLRDRFATQLERWQQQDFSTDDTEDVTQLIAAAAAQQVMKVAANAAVSAEAFRAAAAAAVGSLRCCSSSLWQLPPVEWLLGLLTSQQYEKEQPQQQGVACAARAACLPCTDTDVFSELLQPASRMQPQQILRHLRRSYSKTAALSQLVQLATAAAVTAGAAAAAQQEAQAQPKSTEAVFSAALQAASRNAAAAAAATTGRGPLVLPHSAWRRILPSVTYQWGARPLPPSLAATEAALQQQQKWQQRDQRKAQQEELQHQAHQPGPMCQEHHQQQKLTTRRPLHQPSDEQQRRLRRRLCLRTQKLVDECMRLAKEETQSTRALLERLRL